jgi:hypothetical protein
MATAVITNTEQEQALLGGEKKRREAGVSGNKAEQQQANALHRAASSGDDAKVAAALLEIGVHSSGSRDSRIQMLNHGDSRQWTPLHGALRHLPATLWCCACYTSRATPLLVARF